MTESPRAILRLRNHTDVVVVIQRHWRGFTVRNLRFGREQHTVNYRLFSTYDLQLFEIYYYLSQYNNGEEETN